MIAELKQLGQIMDQSSSCLNFILPKTQNTKLAMLKLPQHNGRVERKHKHILNMGRALLFKSKLAKHFQSYAITHATYLINRIPSPIIQNEAPFYVRFGVNFDLNELKLFGSLCYASTIQSHRTKLDPRSRKCLLLGYKPNVKEVVLLDLNTKSIFHLDMSYTKITSYLP